MRRIFKLIYPDEKIKECIEILPRSTGIQIQGNKLYLHFTVVNLSCIYNLKIEVIDALCGCYELTKFRVAGHANPIFIRNSISVASMERDLDEKQKEYFLRELVNKDGININIRCKILASNWFLGNRVIEEKIFEEANVLVRR